MSKGKNYNSIVFLTTLSVYLGLVLVGGATPQVLAQAALTRNFDIQIEAEIKDDLDNKPENESCDDLKAKADEQDSRFIEEYARAVLAILKKSYEPEISGYQISLKTSYQASDGAELFDKFFPTLRKDLTVEGFDYTQDKDKFSGKFNLKLKFENKDISPFVSFYAASLNYRRCLSGNTPENVILKNTEISHENNQIFIVTRLPRASIDAILAKNAR